MSGYVLAFLAVLATTGLSILWPLAMKRVEMGERLWLLNSLAVAATVFGVAALMREPGIFGGLLAGVSILVGAVFLGLGFFLSAMSKQSPAVAVGAPLPVFIAPDENGNPFDIASLLGNPVLLKFFRGHW
jgi:uncharacterized membrane protein YedE/YeeE